MPQKHSLLQQVQLQAVGQRLQRHPSQANADAANVGIDLKRGGGGRVVIGGGVIGGRRGGLGSCGLVGVCAARQLRRARGLAMCMLTGLVMSPLWVKACVCGLC